MLVRVAVLRVRAGALIDDEAAQAAIEASMKDVLSKNSGEVSYPRRAAFDGPLASLARLVPPPGPASPSRPRFGERTTKRSIGAPAPGTI